MGKLGKQACEILWHCAGLQRVPVAKILSPQSKGQDDLAIFG